MLLFIYFRFFISVTLAVMSVINLNVSGSRSGKE